MPTASDSQNPWLQLYLPLALQEPRTEPKQVLLHAILSVSAFSRAGLASVVDGERYREQGVKHGEEAVRRLRGAIDGDSDGMGEGKGKGMRVKDAVDKQALLAAALTISTIDVCSSISCSLLHTSTPWVVLLTMLPESRSSAAPTKGKATLTYGWPRKSSTSQVVSHGGYRKHHLP